MLYFLSFLLALSSNVSWAQEYLLTGNYTLDSSRPGPIHFTLKWKEENGKIEGRYNDSRFGAAASVKGSATDVGRTFQITYSQVVQGVKTITFLTSQDKARETGLEVPLAIVTRDARGNPLTNVDIKAQFLSAPVLAQRQEESNCQEGFGSLAGYCGIYSGVIAEESDGRNRCNLLFTDAIRLQLDTTGQVILHFGEVNQITAEPFHQIGRTPYDPNRTTVDVLSRQCRALVGTTFPTDDCKLLNLSGTFSIERTKRHFTGTYTIRDEKSLDSCSYSLSLDLME